MPMHYFLMVQIVRLDNYVVSALFRSIRLETFSGKAIEHIDHCHPNLSQL